MIRLCTGLIPAGGRLVRPCRARVMRPLGLCERCRPAAPRKPAPPGSTAKYQAAWRRRRAQAGLAPLMEIA